MAEMRASLVMARDILELLDRSFANLADKRAALDIAKAALVQGTCVTMQAEPTATTSLSRYNRDT